MGAADACNAPTTWLGVRLGIDCSARAAMPAACGVAAEVPKKLRYVALLAHCATLDVSSKPVSARETAKNEVLMPSGAVKAGFCRTSGTARRVPELSNRIGSPPAEEKASSFAGEVPHSGVSAKNAAATAAAPLAPGCP